MIEHRTRHVQEPRSRQQFSLILSRPEDEVDLAEASLLIACEEYPGLDVAAYLRRFDAMAATLRDRLDASGHPERAVEALHAYLFGELGFHGNLEDYYDPRNSFLNQVLDRRTGIPISLSAVYMEVGRRVGLSVDGVGLPGHFIVRVRLPSGGLLVDPFQSGARLTQEDCQERLDRIYGKRVVLDEAMLAPSRPRAILGRLLRNLKAVYLKDGDHERALGMVDLLLRVEPGSSENLRDRGLLYAALGCYRLAADDLEEVVQRWPGLPESGDLQRRVQELRRKASRVN